MVPIAKALWILSPNNDPGLVFFKFVDHGHWAFTTPSVPVGQVSTVFVSLGRLHDDHMIPDLRRFGSIATPSPVSQKKSEMQLSLSVSAVPCQLRSCCEL